MDFGWKRFLGQRSQIDFIDVAEDIAGVAYSDEVTELKSSPGGTGYGIRLLEALIKQEFVK